MATSNRCNKFELFGHWKPIGDEIYKKYKRKVCKSKGNSIKRNKNLSRSDNSNSQVMRLSSKAYFIFFFLNL